MGGYTLQDAVRIAGVQPAQLRRWVRAGLLRLPSAASAPVDWATLRALRSLRALHDAGVPLRHIRTGLRGARRRLPGLTDAVVALRPHPVRARRGVVVAHRGALVEPDGQCVFDFRPAHAPAPVASLDEARSVRAPSDPTDAVGWFARGCALDDDPRTRAEARQAYLRALELWPDFADAWCNLGTLHYQEGDRDAARHAYERALGCEADHVEAHMNLAGLFEEAGDVQPALRHYRAAMRIDPLRAEVQLALALLYDGLRLTRRAREHWRRYLQLDPSGAWAAIARRRLSD